MAQPWQELPLFDVPVCPPRSVKTAADLVRELRPVWRAWTGAHMSCDLCVADLHAAGGRGPLPARAKHVRTVKATGDQLRACDAHAEPLRAADEAAKGRRR